MYSDTLNDEILAFLLEQEAKRISNDRAVNGKKLELYADAPASAQRLADLVLRLARRRAPPASVKVISP